MTSPSQPNNLPWQSTLIEWTVFCAVGANLALYVIDWPTSPCSIWVLGWSALLGLVAWRRRAATGPAAFAGAAIAASLTVTTKPLNACSAYSPLQSLLVPLIVLMILTSLTTRIGRNRKEELGVAEHRQGRIPSQVAANLGLAALAATIPALMRIARCGRFPSNLQLLHRIPISGSAIALWPLKLSCTISLAALAEAAADTVSSELGQVFGGRPRMLTTLRPVAPGTDGAITVIGTLAGALAGALVSAAGAAALAGGWQIFGIASIAAIFGLLFDSLLGATLERRGWLNNDAVNFLSTTSAALVAFMLWSYT